MAITNDLSFLPVLDQFSMSWEMAEAAAGGAILVEGGVDAVGALGLRTEMALGNGCGPDDSRDAGVV